MGSDLSSKGLKCEVDDEADQTMRRLTDLSEKALA